MSELHENYTYIPDYNSLSLVGRVLRTRIGSDSLLCCHKNINKYSRRKPYVFGPEGSELYGADGTNENVIKSHNFGLTPKLIGMPAQSAQNVNSCVEAWGQWVRPEPQNEEHTKRLNDYIRYWHLAGKHLLSLDSMHGSWINPTQALSVKVTFESEYLDRIVTIYDIAYKEGSTALSIGDMRLTVVICSRVDAQYGKKWIIAQSAYTIAEVNNRAATLVPAAQMFKLEVLINIYAAIGELYQDFGNCFLAVGFAPTWTSGTKKSVVGYNDMYYYTPTTAPSTLPLKLVNPDMDNNGWQVAKFCTMQRPTSGPTPFDVYVSLTVPVGVSGAPERPRYKAYSDTKNGQSGMSVNIYGNAYCEITNVADGYASHGYIVFVFTVNTDIGSFYYYAMMQKGCAAGSANEKALYMSQSQVSGAVPGLAPDDFDATEAKKYLVDSTGELNSTEADDMKDLSKKEGIFIAGATEVTSVTLYIDGAPSEIGGNAYAVPTILTSGTNKMSYDLKDIDKGY